MSKYVTCYCGKKYQYRRSYTKHTKKCKIFQIEIKKPLPLLPAITRSEMIKSINEEAKAVIDIWKKANDKRKFH